MLNVQKLAARLHEYEAGQKSSEYTKLLWKPKEGNQTVRIVPYKFCPDYPFIELKFYYNLAGKHYLAPITFGKPDPIQELIERLRASGVNEELELAKKLQATTRIYVPVIVRGEEEQGVRFWGFGVQVHKQLLKLMNNPNWNTITSFTEGHDIEVEFKKTSAKKNVKTGQFFPETIITPIPTKTPVVDPTRRDLMEKVKEQTDILKIFPLKSYDELKTVVNNYLNPDGSDDVNPEDVVQEQVSESHTPSPTAATPPTQSSPSSPQGENLANEFERFFKS